MVLLKEVKEVKSTVRGKLFQTLTIRWLKNCERQLVEQDAFANLYGWHQIIKHFDVSSLSCYY